MPRRQFLRHVAFVSALVAVPGLFAEQLALTPRQTEGPFYPDVLPLDTDNDLVVVNDTLTPAVGEMTWLSGRRWTQAGSPIRNARSRFGNATRRGFSSPRRPAATRRSGMGISSVSAGS